jgi:hypothetical protein
MELTDQCQGPKFCAVAVGVWLAIELIVRWWQSYAGCR